MTESTPSQLDRLARIPDPPSDDAGVPAQVLWALCRASCIPPPKRIPPSLLAAAVRIGKMQSEEALLLIEKTHHAKALAALAAELPNHAISRALSVARTFQEPCDVIAAAACFLPRLAPPERDRLVGELLERARELDSAVELAGAFGPLLRNLGGATACEVCSVALKRIAGLESPGSRALGIGQLAADVPPACLDEALALARSIEHPASRCKALISMLAKAPTERTAHLFSEALATLDQVTEIRSLPEILAELAPVTPVERVVDLLRRLPASTSKAWTMEAFAILVARAPDTIADEAWRWALQVEGEYDRIRAACEILRRFPEVLGALQTRRTLQDVLGLEEGFDRWWLFGRLGPGLPGELVRGAWEAALRISDEVGRARALSGLVPALPADLLQTVEGIAGGFVRGYSAWLLLIPLLERTTLADRPRVAREVWVRFRQDPPGQLDPGECAVLASALPLVKDAELTGWALLHVPRPSGKDDPDPFVKLLLEQLPADQMATAVAHYVEVQLAHGDDLARLIVTRALAPYLAPAVREVALREFQAACGRLSGDRRLAALIPGIMPGTAGKRDFVPRYSDVPPYDLQCLLHKLSRVHEDDFPELMDALERASFGIDARGVPASLRRPPPAQFGRVLRLALRSWPSGARAAWLAALISRAPVDDLAAILEHAAGIGDEETLAKCIEAAADRLPPAAVPTALNHARSLRTAALRAAAIVSLAPRVEAGEYAVVLREGWSACLAIRRESARLRAFHRLLRHVGRQAWTEALSVARNFRKPLFRIDAFLLLASLGGEEADGALDEAIRASGSIRHAATCARAIEALGERYATRHRPILMEIARGLRDAEARARALFAVAHGEGGEQSETLVREATQAADATRDCSRRAAIYLHMLRRSTGVRREELSRSCLAASGCIDHPEKRAWAFMALGPFVHASLRIALERQIREAACLGAVQRCAYEQSRLTALALAYVPEALERPKIWRGMEAMSRIGASRSPGLALVEVLRATAGKLPREAIEAVGAVSTPFHRNALLRALVPAVPDEFVPDLLALVLDLPDPAFRAWRFVELAPRLPRTRLREALTIARTLQTDEQRQGALEGLLPALCAWCRESPEEARMAWREEIMAWSRRERAQVFRDLATLVPFVLALASDPATAAEEIYRAVNSVGGWRP